MDKVAKEIWCEALRSGEFKQGKGYLKNQRGGKNPSTSYCCLGVACAVLPGIKGTSSYSGRTVTLSPNSRELMELTDSDVRTLIDLNDHKEYTFPEIAAWIEANL